MLSSLESICCILSRSPPIASLISSLIIQIQKRGGCEEGFTQPPRVTQKDPLALIIILIESRCNQRSLTRIVAS